MRPAPARHPRPIPRCSRWLPSIALVALVGWAATARSEMFVLTSTAVRVFADGAVGDVAPLRSIEGAATTLFAPSGLVVDLGRREIYVSNGNGSVLVFAMDASGNVAPIRTLAGATTELATFLGGLALDLENDELWVASPSNGKVLVYDRGASGDSAPKRSITGASTGLSGPVSLLIDLVHDEVYVSDAFGSPKEVSVFDRTASGDATPKRSLNGTFAPANPRQTFVDLDRDELIVVDVAPSISTYARTASGNDPRLRMIAGPTTSLEFPVGLVVTASGEMLVSDNGTNGPSLDSVLGFDQDDTGDVAPVRELAGTNPNLSFPAGLASDRAVHCSESHVVSSCLFRESFEAPDLCRWSAQTGAPPC